MIKGRVLITGGAGFLGRGILRKAKTEKWDAKFTVYSRDEYKQHLCRDKYPDANYVLGDVRDTDRLTLAMLGHDVVIHAAALKYVPESELNVNESVGINIIGSQSVVKAAREARIARVIAISTDKAVEPANMYGLSKAVAEKIFWEASRFPGPKFLMCRYGNVIGSTGSVLPVFKKQFETTGRVRVTDPDMTRFWLSIDEAVKIIELTNHRAENGAVIVPSLRSTFIGDIAKYIAGDAIDIVGKRPGEKQHEILLTKEEHCRSITDILFDVNYWSYKPHSLAVSYDNSNVAHDAHSNYVTHIPMDEFFTLAADAETV